MSYISHTYQILIASPSDVEDERELAVRVIQEWNDLYSSTRKVVLLPVRWETHTAPEYGTRPQEVINRAIVDNCDLLVGIFWTRIGTATGVAESGSLEEIARVANAGKPVMLYFSNIGADPDKIDLSQLAQLKTFKENTYPNALTESYKSIIEFRDKFAKQLELKVRDLQAADRSGQPPPLQLLVASGAHLGGSPTAVVERPEITDIDAALANDTHEVRERVMAALRHRIESAVGIRIILAITNTGSSGIRNLYVRMLVRTSADNISVEDAAHQDLLISNQYVAFKSFFSRRVPVVTGIIPNPVPVTTDLDDFENLTRRPDGWEFTFEWEALQPQRVRLVKPKLWITTETAARLEFVARVFADTFPVPVELTACLDVTVRPKPMTLAEFLTDLESLKGTDVDAADLSSARLALRL